MTDCLHIVARPPIPGGRTVTALLLATAGAFLTAHLCAQQPIVANGGFERGHRAPHPASVDQGFGTWQTGGEGVVPDSWILNPAFPGKLTIVSSDAPEKRAFVRITANGERDAHIYIPCPGVKPGVWYVLRARVRGSGWHLGFYEYFTEGPMRTPSVLSDPGDESGEWHEVSTYYQSEERTLANVSVYIRAEQGETVDVDDIRLEPLPDASDPAGLPPVVIENDYVRVEINGRGLLTSFTDLRTGENYAAAAPGTPVFAVGRRGGLLPVLAVRRRGDRIEASFLDPEVTVTFTLDVRPHYVTLEVAEVTGEKLDWLQLCRFRVELSKSIGLLLNVARDERFAACLLACNDQTESAGANPAQGDLISRCYPEFGLAGAKVALVACPATDLLDTIEQVELEQDLPHPMRDGVWLRRHPARFHSYLMAVGLNQANIDAVIAFAKDGFGCVEILNWWQSTPTYAVNRQLYPDGLAGLTACADKIHAAGLDVGLHVMQGMVGWAGAGLDDPYVTPAADDRLLTERSALLADAVTSDATEMTLDISVAEWPDAGDLLVAGEIIRYEKRSQDRFLECKRGWHGTTPRAHEAGTETRLLVNCFPLWGYCIYAPDVKTNMIDEICANIARVCNATGADMAYFDGGEELALQPPHWRHVGRIALGVMSRLDKPMIIGGNSLYTNLSWHVITRGSPSFDPIYFGRRPYTLREKGQNPARWDRDLLTGDVGWFAPHTRSLSTDAVTPEEVALLCLKAVGGKAPISFQVDANNLYANRRIPEMLEIIRCCDALKHNASLSETVCGQLARPMAEHTVDRDADGLWRIRRLGTSPPVALVADNGPKSDVEVTNPATEQVPWMRLRARPDLAAYGTDGNVVLVNAGTPLKPDGTQRSETVHSVEPATEATPDGRDALNLHCRNGGDTPPGWCRFSNVFEKTLDLSRHRRLALWVKSDGTGGILNVQLISPLSVRDHYVDLNTPGWVLKELVMPERDRFYDYTWPYTMHDVMYQPFRYDTVTGVCFYFNDLPAGTDTIVSVGPLEALQEHHYPLVRPRIEGPDGMLEFPVSMASDDYLEMDWAGICRHFGPNGGLRRIVQPKGTLTLPAGHSRLRTSARTGPDASPRLELMVAFRGDALPLEAGNPAPVGAAPPEPWPQLTVLPAGQRGPRFTKGPFELVGNGRPYTHPSAADGDAVLTYVNDADSAYNAVLAMVRRTGLPLVDTNDPQALVVEGFRQLDAFAPGEDNRFDQYVLGTDRRLTPEGPVRAGVMQTFALSKDQTGLHGTCAIYEARNEGRSGGWGGRGRRFDPPLNLKAYRAGALWVHGDNHGERLRLQFRDSQGHHADSLLPIDFSGWRLHAFPLEAEEGFQWDRVEYLILYLNDLPGDEVCALRLASFAVYPTLQTPGVLTEATFRVGARAITSPLPVIPGGILTLDDDGTWATWGADGEPVESFKGNEPLVLPPGETRVSFAAVSTGGPRGQLEVHLLPTRPDPR